MYLGWFDDSKKEAREKIAGAVNAYQERFKTAPTVVLVNEADFDAAIWAQRGIQVRIESYVRRNNFLVGREDGYQLS